MFWIKYVRGLLRTLNENTSPNEIAAGFALGAVLGLLPKTNLLALVVWMVVLILQVNISMATAAVVVFAVVGQFTDPLAERLGYWLLTDIPALQGFWTTLYNTPIIPFSNFNNTLVIGNFVLSLLLLIPVFFLAKRGIVMYRAKYRARVMEWKVMKVLQASSFFDLYKRWIQP